MKYYAFDNDCLTTTLIIHNICEFLNANKIKCSFYKLPLSHRYCLVVENDNVFFGYSKNTNKFITLTDDVSEHFGRKVSRREVVKMSIQNARNYTLDIDLVLNV